MKPVTDPDLLRQLNSGAPAGVSGSSTGPSPTASPSGASSGYAAPARPGPSDPTAAELAAEGMSWWEKGLTGVGGGLRRTYLGAKDLVGLGSPEEQQELKDWSSNKEALGGWGTAGEITGELAATAIPGMGASAGAAKLLTKALPVATRLGSVGGRTFNLGAAGRAAVEGGVAGTIQAPAEGESRVGNAVQGATLGAALPLTLAGGAKAVNVARRELSPGVKQSTIRGYNALERTLGKDRFEAAISQVENPTPAQLPRTTAAMAQDRRLGALERGARGRGDVPFDVHDENVARKSWDVLKESTPYADQLDTLRQGTKDILDEGQSLMDSIPMNAKQRAEVAQELLKLRNSNEVIANPKLAREVDTAIAAMDNPDATLGVLPQLYRFMGENMQGGSNAVSNAREVFRRVADEGSDGQFSNILSGYGVAQDELNSGLAAKSVRDTFMKDDMVPLTSPAYGQSGTPTAFPSLQDRPLRQALSGKVDVMRPEEAQATSRLADELATHEIYTNQLAAGATSPDRTYSEGVASAALNAGPLWRLRGALSSYFRGLNDKTQRIVDQALLNPEDFLKMVAMKRALNRPLEPWEDQLQGLLAAQGSAIGSASSGY